VTLDHYGHKTGVSVCFSSLGCQLGHRVGAQIFPSIKVGYEMYYSLLERILSGSLGISINFDQIRPVHIHASTNPIVGSLHFDIASRIGHQDLWARAYLDHNAHTSDSDFGLALKYSNRQNETLHARLSRSKVLLIPSKYILT
jgi:hypothetical protein